MKPFLKNENGNVLVFTALATVVLFGFTALAIDVGYMYTARNQLQSAVDAAALAGASGLTYSQAEATNRAIHFASLNNCINENVQISPSDVTFPITNRIQVQANRSLNLFFARVLGINTATISVLAAAEIGTLDGVRGLKPWAVPDFGWGIGEPVVIKSGNLGAPATEPGYFYPIDFPPLNRGTPIPGAQEYEQNIVYGSSYDVFIGDVLAVEPGNMVGPTQQGVSSIIAQDPNAYWNGTMVVNSQYGDSSPRIVLVPLYDPDFPPDSGRNTVEVIGLAAFFIEDVQGRDVIGRFLNYTTTGHPGNGNSYLYGVKLVQ